MPSGTLAAVDDHGRAHPRTFKPRRRRLSPSRLAAFDRLLPEWSLDVTGHSLDLSDVFGRAGTTVLEVGSGAGENLVAAAMRDRAVDYIASEVHTPGVARLLVDIEAHALSNVRVVHGDALEFCGRLADESLDEVWVFFPDPWPKPRQRQRRIIHPDRLQPLLRCLRRGGMLRMATDIADYAEQMEQVCDAIDCLDGGVVERCDGRAMTRFEAKGLDAGRNIVDLAYQRV